MSDILRYNEVVAFDDPEHEALMGVWWVGQLLKKNARRFFSQWLSSEMQFNIMMLLKYADHPMSQQELSEKLFVDKSNLTGVAGRMEAAGLIVRRVDPEDARAYQLSLTPAGADILERVEMPYREKVKKTMSAFNDDELRQLSEFMGRLEAALTEK